MSNSDRNLVRNDRFYSPPAMRRYSQQVKPPKHQEKKKQLETNLDRFMKYTTPILTFPKTSMEGWRNDEDNYHPYFILGDLWESFKESSAYGVGVPLVLNERDSVVQYYAPSLSAIQLYVDPATTTTSIRQPGEDSDYESSRATSSDGSYEAGAAMARGPRATKIDNSVTQSLNKLRLRDDVFVGCDDDEDEIKNPPGLLIFEYFESESPFHRVPLANKISELEFKFPELNTYRSCDLTQSSWLSVAWYPIYRIPVGPSLQNIDTSFLTFHSLSTPLRSKSLFYPYYLVHPHGSTAREVHEARMPCRLSLPIFGLAVYKFKNADWTGDGVHGTKKINSLISSIENWLRNLNVHHPDYVFFKSHYLHERKQETGNTTTVACVVTGTDQENVVVDGEIKVMEDLNMCKSAQLRPFREIDQFRVQKALNYGYKQDNSGGVRCYLIRK